MLGAQRGTGKRDHTRGHTIASPGPLGYSRSTTDRRSKATFGAQRHHITLQSARMDVSALLLLGVEYFQQTSNNMSYAP